VLLLLLRVLSKRRALERSCRWTNAQLREHQARSLRSIRQFAYAHSPFYRRFHRGLEERPLTDLPILTKAILMENFDDLVTDRSIHLSDVEAFLSQAPGLRLFRNRYVALATSGSTGRRGVFLFNDREWLTSLASISRPMFWSGLRPTRLPLPRMAMIASTAPSHYSARVGLSLSSRLMPALRLDAAEPLDSMVRSLNEWQPEVLAAYPSILRPLADEQVSGRLRIPLRSVATSAEVLTPETRNRVEQAWHVKVYDTYGATEYAPIAAECAYGRKHLFEDGAIIEIADERGPVPPGVAGDRVLLTIFNRWTQPLIRYEISDMVRPIAGACECGRPFQLIEAVEGRFEDVLFFPARASLDKTVSVHPNAFHSLLETVPAAGWQVIQEDDYLSVNLAGLRDPEICRPLERSLRELLEKEGALVPAIRVLGVDELRRGATGKAPLILARAMRKAEAAR